MPEENFKRKLCAILSADVQGYSRLMGEDEDATIRILTTYRELMSTIIQKHRGRVVDSPGDNLLAEFLSVVDAVRCAVEIQEELRVRNAELPDNRRMEFRIGINLGDVVEEGERIYGDGVNITARVEGLAGGGGICISGTVYDSIKNKLSLSYESLGEHTVKNITEPVRVYRMRVGPEATTPVEEKKKAGPRRWFKPSLAAIGVVLIISIGLSIWHFYFRPPPIEPASPDKMAFPLPDNPSIAVLPFVNLNKDPELEYIADGITENITTALSKLPEMFVIDRTSTKTYKGKSVKAKQVSEELGVRYLLEGSVFKEGDQVRITAQLIDAIKGHHLWAEKYDRKTKSFLNLLDDITKKIGTALQVQLTYGEFATKIAGTDNFDAWGYHNKAIGHYFRFNPIDNIKAREFCEQAVKLDPNYLPPITLMAHSHITDIKARWSKSPKHSKDEAVKWAQKAVKINASDAGTLTLLGNIYIVERQYEKAIAEIKKAIAIDPNYSAAYLYCSDAMYRSGRFEEAIEMAKKSIRLHGPFPNPGLLNFLGTSYHMAGHYEEALSVSKRLLDLSRKGKYSSKGAHLRLAAAYIRLGRDQEARDHVTEVLKNDPTLSMEWVIKVTKGRFKDTKHLERYINDYRLAGIPEHPPLALPDKPSIAVLPFTNMSGDPDQEYFSDGLTEDIITALSKVPGMFVIARNSTFTYKGKPVKVQQVMRELGVRYVLEGSVQRSGDRLRITAQLIDAKSGNHLWSERYDRDLKDLFDLQDDITKNVIMALQIKLTQGDIARISGKGTDNLEAYLKAMKAIPQSRRYNKEGIEIARRLYEEAVALDPNYADAYVGLAWSYFIEANVGWTKTPAKSYEKAIELAKKAISLDELNARAYMLFAAVYAKTGQFEKSMDARKKGLALNPGNAFVNFGYGFALYNEGKFKEAITFFKKAIRIDPKPPGTYLLHLGFAYFWMGQNEETIAVSKKWISREPSAADGHFILGCALIAEGKPEEAVAMLEKALTLKPDGPGWYVGNLAVARLGAGQPEEAITTLREVLGRDPENAEVCRLLSFLLTCEGRFAEALSMAKKAVSLTLAPWATFYDRLGLAHLMMGQYEEAIAAYKKAISVWSEYVGGHIGLTASCSLAGRMEEARAEAAEILRINSKITLEDIAKNGYFNFKKADKERFINALLKAGLK